MESWNQTETCRICGIDLQIGSVDLLHHYNLHWKQFNNESPILTSCAYQQTSDLITDQHHINSEAHGVSCHLHQNFQYTYSPQTEPSNLSLAGNRCSPLNLTGRVKVDSPLTSPLVSSPISAEQESMNTNHITTDSFHIASTELGDYGLNQSYEGFDTMPSCTHPSQNISTYGQNIHLETIPNCELNACKYEIKEKPFNKYQKRESTNKLLDVNICGNNDRDDISNENCSNQFLFNDRHININQDILDSPITIVSKPYTCSVCNKDFNIAEELLEHLTSHDQAKPYRCNLCGVGLSHSSALKRHTQHHNGQKPHSCKICKKGFLQKNDLQRHMLIHNKKLIQCSSCKRKFTSEYLLKRHKCKTAEEDKPFRCEICGDCCTTDVAWSYHMWKHTKNPAFVPCQKIDKPKNDI